LKAYICRLKVFTERSTAERLERLAISANRSISDEIRAALQHWIAFREGVL
jgi:hypothetical protein